MHTSINAKRSASWAAEACLMLASAIALPLGPALAAAAQLQAAIPEPPPRPSVVLP